MAITVTEARTPRPASQEIQDGRIVRNYTRTLLATTTDNNTGPKSVIDAGLSHLGISFGDFYATSTETDTGAVLHKVTPDLRSDDGMNWTITCEYTSALKVDPAQFNVNPLLRPPRISLDSQFQNETKRHDSTGAACVNSAGENLDPLPNVSVVIPTISVTRNKAFGDHTLVKRYVDKYNDGSFLGYDTGELRCVKLKQDGPNWENGILYWVWTLELHAKENVTRRVSQGTPPTGAGQQTVKGWQDAYVDAGTRKTDGGVGNEKAKDSGNVDYTEPIPLNGSGTPLTAQAATVAANIVYRVFDFRGSEDFSALGMI